jgi:signal transduction histidine kinase
MIEIALRADHARVGLLLRDNGIGGVGEVPASVSSRIVRLAGTVRIESPIGKGTALHIDVPRPMTGGNPR